MADDDKIEKPKIAHTSTMFWFALSFGLFLATFGLIGTFSLFVYIILFVAGFLIVIVNWGVNKSKEILASDDVQLMDYEDPYCGIPAVFKNIDAAPQSFKFDKRLTGSSCIDEILQEVLQYFFRDYVHFWYLTISNDRRFLNELQQVIQKCIINLAMRTKEVEWVPFLTTRLVDDFATHLKIYRVTRERMKRHTDEEQQQVDDVEIDLEKTFFEVEREVEKGISRKQICLEDEEERQYLQDISEVLLYLLLPPEDFHNKTVRFFLREIIASSVLLPTVNMICDPDYVNQTISWLCEKETTFTAETFLTAIRFCDDMQDLEETKKRVDLEIAKLRTQDSHMLDSSQSEAIIKKQMNSLLYVRKLCITSMRSLKTGAAPETMINMDTEPDSRFLELLSPYQNMPKMSLKEILEDNTALSYFIEFMGSYNAEHYVFFHLTVEGFRATASQQLAILAQETMKAQANQPVKPNSNNFEQLKQAAANIYEEYVSPRASPRIVLDDTMVRKIVKDIKSNEPSGAYFDAAHMTVYKMLESPKYYGAFLNSTSYLKCLLDLDMLSPQEEGGNASDDDTISVTSTTSTTTSLYEESNNTGQQWTPECDLRYSALIGQAGVVTQFGKSFVNYTVHVCRTTSDGSRNWVVMRRYSDFHDLHIQLTDRFPSLSSWLHLPSKKTFGNMDNEFIKRRKDQLENYIQPLLDTTLLSENIGMFELVASFLEEGDYYRESSEISRKMDHFVKPVKNSLTNVSRAVKNKADTMSKWSEDLTFRTKDKIKDEDVSGKLSDLINSSENENIPLRILLLLMDEVFDLQHRNQWLRRRVVVVLQQIIKTIFGDGMNRKIVDYVDLSTSAEQIAEYLKRFRDSYWPGGVLSETPPERPSDVKCRMRMITRAKMYGSIPDELKRFLGTENVREGVSRVFDLFQHVNLNRRLFYVMFEAFLEETFVDNKFREIFKKIHSESRK